MKRVQRPGKPLASRELHLGLLCDRSIPAALDGWLDTLNAELRDGMAHLAQLAQAQPHTHVLVHCLSFGAQAAWHVAARTPATELAWPDLEAEPHTPPPLDVVLLLDASQSMSDLLAAAQVHQFMLSDLKTHGDVRVRLACFDLNPRAAEEQGCLLFRLSGYTLGLWPPVPADQFGAQLHALRPALWGGYGCALADADSVEIIAPLVAAFDDPDRERILVLVSDEMGASTGVVPIVAQLKQASVAAYVVGLQGGSQAHELLAAQSGGGFWALPTDAHDIAEVIGAAVAQATRDALRRHGEAKPAGLRPALDLLAEQMLTQPPAQRVVPPVLVLLAGGTPPEDLTASLRRLRATALGRKAIRLAIVADTSEPAARQQFCDDERLAIQVRTPTQLAAAIRWAINGVVRAVAAPQVSQDEQGVFAGRVRLPSPPRWHEAPVAPIWEKVHS